MAIANDPISPRAGVGALLGILGLSVLGVPSALLYVRHPWWFSFSTAEAIGWPAGIFLSGIAVAAVAWFSGRRSALPRRRAAARAAAAALLLCGFATGATAIAIDRWETPDANAPELRIHSSVDGKTMLGTGGRFLYVTTSRGPIAGATWDEHRRRDEAPLRSSPTSAWTIDLSRDAAVEDVRFDAFFTILEVDGSGWVRQEGGPYVPTPFVARFGPLHTASPGRTEWIDTETNRAFAVMEGAVDARVIGVRRAVAKATTPLRDSKGRRVWMLEGYVERDGDETRVPVPSVKSPLVDGLEQGLVERGVLGWTGYGATPPEQGGHGIWCIDHETLAAREVSSHDMWVFNDSVFPTIRPESAHPTPYSWVLDDGHSIGFWTTGPAERVSEVRSGWWIVDHQTGTARPFVGPSLESPYGDFHLVDVGTVLIRDPVGAMPNAFAYATRLTLWTPLSNEHRLVTSSSSTLLSPRSVEALARLPDGRWLLKLLDDAGYRTGRGIAFARLDAKSGILAPLTGWSTVSLDPIAVDIDGSFLAIEDGRRVVRFSDAGVKRVVVWPK